ncbi:MAG: translocation/assembly module TamB domain-containing protein [Terricaulis sp.]
MTNASSPGKRRAWKLATAGATLAAGGLALAIGPGAAWLVDHFADGRQVWRLGEIKVDGVRGAWLGDLHAARVSLSDKNGAWLSGADVELKWRPLDLLFGALHVERINVERIDVARAPALSAPRQGRGGIDVEIGDGGVDLLRLDEQAFGEAADFSLDLSLAANDQKLRRAELSLVRVDSVADRLMLSYRDDFALSLDLFGAAGGVFARALGVPDAEVAAHAEGSGGAGSGATRYSATLDATAVLDGEARWNAAEWSAHTNAHLQRLPALRNLARRIGEKVELSASGARGGRFRAHANTPFLTLDLSGVADEHFALQGPASFTATTQRLSAITREAPFSFGPATLEGEVRSERGIIAIRANARAQELDVLGRRTSFSGPLEAALTPDDFTLSATLSAPNDAPALFGRGVLSTELSYDRRRGRFALNRAELKTDAVLVTARGWVSGGDGEFSGDWRARQLSALAPGFDGAASGRWRAHASLSEHRIWTTAIDGVGKRVSGAGALAQLLGETPRLDALLRNETGGVTVSHARVNGARVRLGATGRIVRGNADLALEASARGPVTIGGVELAGAGDASGRLTGPLARPALSLRAALGSFHAAGVALDQPILELTLAPGARSYGGPANLVGTVSGQPFSATSDLHIAGGALELEGLDVAVGGLRASGAARFAERGPSAQLEVAGLLDGLAPGVAGRVEGQLHYAADALLLNAHIVDARAGVLQIRTATLRAEGPPSNIAARVELSGWMREAPLSFAGGAQLDTERGVSTLAVEGEGTLAGAAIATSAPLRMRFERGAIQTSANLVIGDGTFTGEWRERGRAVSGSARVVHAPLAPFAAIWGEQAAGRIDGELRFASAGRGLSGAASLNFSNARFAGRQRGPLDISIVGALEPTRLTAEVDARSIDGLEAHFEADAPVVTSAAPIRIALAPEQHGRARWSARGPADSLWAAARFPDQSLSGALDGEGELQFGAGSISGAGHVQIVGGRFEDKLSAVSLVDLNARVSFDETGMTIERFEAAGVHGGRLSATGGSANPREGHIAVRIEGMRIVNRPEARATANGELALRWEGLHSTLSGALEITAADLDVAASADAGIPTIDVIEINSPETGRGPAPTPTAPRRNGSTALDVRIHAPGRVFTRGRGVEAEWSLDMRLASTARNPQLYGEARAVRGALALSGQPFEVDNARIFFNGDPLDAQIDLTAQRDTADLSARIRLTGTARDPEIAFSSDPALPEDEILPQVLFGRSVQDLSPFEGAQLAASLAALSGRASLDIVDAARAAAGRDRFNLRQDADGGFLVAGGVYLTRDVYVEVARTGLGQAQSRVEWTVRPRLVLVTSFIGNGDQRVSLRWRRESD